MSVTTITGIANQIAEALAQVRRCRHQDGCTCFAYRNGGAPFCTPQESSWCSILDRLLDKVS